MSAHLSVDGLTVRAPGKTLVADVTFSCAAGETVALVGASGSGKSTVALALLGLLDPALRADARRVALTDRDGRQHDLLGLTGKDRRALCGQELAIVFQDPLAALNPLLTIGRQIEEAIAVHEHLTRKEMTRRIEAALSEARLPDARAVARSLPHEISGGMRQRALIALALAAQPRLLIADEPTTALDPVLRNEIVSLLEDLRDRRSLSLVLITHDMSVVGRLADQVVVLEDGRQVERAARKTLFADPQSGAARTLIDAIPKIDAAAVQSIAADEPVLDLNNVSASYTVRTLFGARDGKPAVEGLTLAVRRGEIVGLVGSSGSGKTTLGRIALSLLPHRDGTVVKADAGAGPPSIQAVFQGPATSLNPRRTVRLLVGEPLLLHNLAKGGALTTRVASLLERVELDPALMDRYAHTLSGGQQQRVAIARALALSPSLIVADEALSALDVVVRAKILKLFRRLADEGVAFLLIAHDLAAVAAVCERVAVMDGGRIVELGSASALFRDPKSPATVRLVEAARHLRADMPEGEHMPPERRNQTSSIVSPGRTVPPSMTSA